MIDKRCETCVHWTRDEKPSVMITWWGLCDTLVAENGVVYVSERGDGTASTRDAFECPAHRDKPTGPFVVEDSKFEKCTLVSFRDSREGFSVRIKRDEGDRLVAWLNEMVAEREEGK